MLPHPVYVFHSERGRRWLPTDPGLCHSRWIATELPIASDRRAPRDCSWILGLCITGAIIRNLLDRLFSTLVLNKGPKTLDYAWRSGSFPWEISIPAP
jgi:hypothetical protein